jgi:hypothetical protein
MRKRVIIYVLIDPRNGEIRYVGKTICTLPARLSNHIREAKYTSRSNHKNNWVNSILKEGYKPIIQDIDFTEEENWEWLEIYWIAQFKAWGFKLVNNREGGQGGECSFPSSKKGKPGRKWSQESKIKASLSHTGRKDPIDLILKRSKKCKEYYKHNISKLKGKPNNKISKKVIKLDYNYNFIEEYNSAKEASIKINSGITMVSKCCQNKVSATKGFFFIFKNDYDSIKKELILNKINGVEKEIINYYFNTWKQITGENLAQKFNVSLFYAKSMIFRMRNKIINQTYGK